MVSKLLKFASFFVFPFVILFLAFFFFFFGIYSLFPWLDNLLHFMGGISIAYTSILFLREFEEEIEIRNKIIFIIIIASIVSLASVLWELWEFTFGKVFSESFFVQEGLEDTLLDLFFGVLGGVCGGVFSKI